jgi:hypothetical protein
MTIRFTEVMGRETELIEIGSKKLVFDYYLIIKQKMTKEKSWEDA